MFGGGQMFRSGDLPGEEDTGSGNNEETRHTTSTTGPSHVANDEPAISTPADPEMSQNGETPHESKAKKIPGSGVKAKRKKKQRKHRTDSNKGKSNLKPLESNGRSRKSGMTAPTQTSKRKRNGRLVRLVSIDSKIKDHNSEPSSTTKKTSIPPLPRNQYVTTLRRRAVRKQEDNIAHDSDEYGDISLGMKLIVYRGRVIVQYLNSLGDGLASPAQLAGVVQRGDILLAVGNLSLANLPITELMEGLRPLSTPDAGGLYQRSLELRFEAAAGMDLLIEYEKEQARVQENKAADAMFTLFPMVDQLSGTPYEFDSYPTIQTGNNENGVDIVEEAKDGFQVEDILLSDSKTLDEVLDNFSLNFDSLISTVLAKERNSDRDRYESTYFDLREGISDLLRTTLSMEESEKNSREMMLSKVERLELGRKIMKITKALELNLEDIDKGRDARPQKWNSGLSVRSGASSVVKRQYNTDGTITSFPSSYNSPLDLTVDEDSIGSDDSMDDVDADKLLLGLAARDTIWRKLVITMLNKAADELKNRDEEKSKEASSPSGTIDFKQLGYFLFRENASRMSKRKVKSFALPPQEITHVLFDLATFIATTSHDDITTFGGSSKLSSNISTLRSVTTKSGVRGRASVRGDFLLAKRFVLDEALPHWLKSFEPLKLDQRMVLWPGQRTDEPNGGASRSSTQKKKKAPRENGNNPFSDDENELKSETCFLATYFCTEKIIGGERNEETSTTFILSYGAYIQIHTCLSFASFVKDEAAISDLLQVASDDPSHRDAMKEIQKSGNMLFYDSSKLSAVLQSLKGIRFETKEEQRKVILDLCVSGYPDIQPWQVQAACLSAPQSYEERIQCSSAEMENLYYAYLCQLLNPIDGNEGAREDSSLLKEFCERSISTGSSGEIISTRMENFLNIASPSSKYQTCYRRDLMMLLELSSKIENHSLSLDLVDEIIRNTKLSSSEEASRRTLGCLRKIGNAATTLCSNASTETMGFDNLKRVLILFEKMSTKTSRSWQNSINVPDEIFTLLKQWKIQKGSSGDDDSMYFFIDFVINVSSEPAHVVKALSLWSSHHCGDALFSRLEHLLRRGIHFAVVNGELSGTLLRLKHARKTFKEVESNSDKSNQRKDAVGIWESLGKGDISIEK